MTGTPPHPNLLLGRQMAGWEMLHALRHEGMFGIGQKDFPTAQNLANAGLIVLELWDKGRGWHVCTLEDQA